MREDGVLGTKWIMIDIPDQILSYTKPVILVGASPVPTGVLLDRLPDDWHIIAADGGANAVLDAGRRPELVIGDMDSAAALPDNLAKMRLDGQDDTDLEKCLQRITAPLIIGAGFLEGRFDHALGAIHALMMLRHDRPVMLIGNQDLVLRLQGDVRLSLDPGTRISVWPLGRQKFAASTGLKWPIDGMEMMPGRLVGTSNEVNASTIEIRTSPDAKAGSVTNDGYALILPILAMDTVLRQLGSAN